MLRVERAHVIRHKVLIEGLSIARVHGCLLEEGHQTGVTTLREVLAVRRRRCRRRCSLNEHLARNGGRHPSVLPHPVPMARLTGAGRVSLRSCARPASPVC